MAFADENGENWQACLDWLFRCGVINQTQDAIADVQQLAQCLRDGVRLCLVINKLKPGAINSNNFSNRPQSSRFLFLKNIRVFLNTCQKFGLKESELFDPVDLIDGEGFTKVIRTLSLLSNSKEARKSDVEGFSLTQEEIYSVRPVFDDDDGDKVYNNLDNSLEDDYEDVYGTLVECAAVRPKPLQQISKKDHCMNELLDTEKKYVDVLTLIVERFKKPLQHEVSDSELKVIFINVESLQELHISFHADLQKSRELFATMTVGQCFLQRKDKFTAYGKFCSHLTRSQDLLHKLLKERQPFKTLVEQLNDAANRRQFRLNELLTVPFQRILKYHLLLKELVKQTAENDPDKRGLDEALDAMQDISLYVNEMKRDSENLDLINEIQKSIRSLPKYLPPKTNLKDYGRRLYDGELKVQSPIKNRLSARYLFLFDKILLICKPKGDGYGYKDFVIISHFQLVTEEEEQGQGEICTFTLRERLAEPGQLTRSYVFQTKYKELYYKWKEAIEMAMDNVCPRDALTDRHVFLLTTFSDGPVTVCAVCKKYLKGMIYQGYKCRKTSIAVHKECITRVNDPSNSGQPARSNGPVSQSAPVRSVHAATEQPAPRRNHAPPANVVQRPSQNAPSNGVVSSGPAPIRQASGASVLFRNEPRLDNLDSFPWFAGKMNRKEADAALQDANEGTYLIRMSTDGGSMEEKFALSVKCSSPKVKHIRISKTNENSYYLVNTKEFPSLSALVEYYQQHSLGENFETMSTALITAYKQNVVLEQPPQAPHIVGYCIAQYDFVASIPNQLSFNFGDCIAITRKTGMWWKGELNNRSGLFPSNYVEEIADS